MTTELPFSPEDELTISPLEIERARALLISPPAAKSGALWLIVGAVLFLLTAGNRGIFDLIILSLVLVIHELGHLLGMRMFGFTDLRMFFIPFFGAAASGRKFGASATEHAVVLLLGPVPGILIGCGLVMLAAFNTQQMILDAGFTFIVINVFNLLPVSPLDGGRLFERLVFNRRLWLEIFFRVVTIAALIGLAVLLATWIFGVLAFFLLIAFPTQLKRAKAGFALVAQHGHLPSNPADLNDADMVILLEAVENTLVATKGTAATMATLRNQAIQELFDRVSSRPASLPMTVILIGVWAAAIVLSLVGGVGWAMVRAVQANQAGA